MSYRFIASDLDGTLLDQHHAVNSLTAATLQSLEARGVQFALATGRHHLDVKGIRDALGVRAHLITSNGARIHDPDGRLIHRQDIAPQLVRALAQPEYAAGSILNFYLDDEWLIDQPCQSFLDMHRDSGLSYRVDNLAEHDGVGVGKVLYIGEHAHLLRVEEALQRRFGDQLYITFSLENCLEVMAAGVSKGHALRLVLGRLDIDPAHCLAFGDGQNDVELLRAAGHPRLMGNAHPRLSSEMPDAHRIASNAESGVAQHLRELFAL
ncbi:Cof-type HAD-IIB family hydrolase [Chromobacterium subtsugae]|uniref:Cof-type HAD-IIB family hydrolase n=1 Tax=Chromobacterium subtsugae TaxID=251747 RepID=UPI00064186FD|nr:Cof-type HAD-IIB family hydrolase [Chromobacterium subtsugae]OBU85589.1 hydrolase [Chromobacterium subtsugae]